MHSHCKCSTNEFLWHKCCRRGLTCIELEHLFNAPINEPSMQFCCFWAPERVMCVCVCVFAPLLRRGILSARNYLSGLIGTPCHETIWYQCVEMWTGVLWRQERIREDRLGGTLVRRDPRQGHRHDLRLWCTWTAPLLEHYLSVRLNNVGWMWVCSCFEEPDLSDSRFFFFFTSFLAFPLYSRSLTHTYILCPKSFPLGI